MRANSASQCDNLYKMKRIRPIEFIIVLMLLPLGMKAQALEKLVDFLTIHINKKAIAQDSSIYPAKAILTPVISYAPETNLSIGIGIKALFKLNGSGDETRTSNIPLTVQYTVENKYLFFSGFEVFWPQEKYVLAGNIWIQSFPSLFYGVGQDTPKTNEEEFGYSKFLIEPIFMKKVFVPYLFLGSGLRYHKISQVDFLPDGLLANSEQTGALGSTSVGVELALLYDSRDNLLNANKGLYVEFTHGIYGKVLSGSHKFQLTRFDIRYFTQPMSKSSSILAFQYMMHFSHGDTPLFELGRLGGDESLRGYFEGRFSDRNLLMGQVEWRQKISRLWGLTAFAGFGGVAATIDQFSLATINPAAGLGLRFLVDPEENLNLRLDFSLGQGELKYYFKIAEAF